MITGPADTPVAVGTAAIELLVPDGCEIQAGEIVPEAGKFCRLQVNVPAPLPTEMT
jgi:hypothetical protein